MRSTRHRSSTKSRASLTKSPPPFGRQAACCECLPRELVMRLEGRAPHAPQATDASRGGQLFALVFPRVAFQGLAILAQAGNLNPSRLHAVLDRNRQLQHAVMVRGADAIDIEIRRHRERLLVLLTRP